MDTTTIEKKTVTVCIPVQQPVSFKRPAYIDINGTTFEIQEARYTKTGDKEPASFIAEYVRGYKDNLAQYGIRSKNLYEDKATLPAATVAAAVLEARKKARPDPDKLLTLPPPISEAGPE